jgi:hypothetical protein
MKVNAEAFTLCRDWFSERGNLITLGVGQDRSDRFTAFRGIQIIPPFYVKIPGSCRHFP